MAKQLEDFKKEFAAIKQDSTKCREEIGKNERFIGQTNGVIEQGCKELGLRIQELKDKGVNGTTIKDFEADKDVKTMLASLNNFLGGIQKELTHITGLHSSLMAKTKTRFMALKKDLTAEIAARKKQLSTKAGTGNKSLPDMEKLLAEVTKFQGEVPYAIVEAFVPEKIELHKKQLDRWIDLEVKQTKAARLTAFQEQMQEQALNSRVLLGNLGRVKTLYEEVLKHCKDASAASAKGDSKALATAKSNIVKPMHELGVLAAPYEKALGDTWLKAHLADSKDKAKIEAGIKAINDMKTKATAELKKVASAQG